MNYNNFKNITIQQIESLVNVVGERSFSKAAKKMRLSQPSLTKHIQHLEDIVGARVMVRKQMGISLTPEGRIIYESAKRIFRMIDETGEKIARMRENEAGNIYIAASTIPATYILPYLIQAFKAAYPDIKCFVKTSDSGETIDMILNDEAEIGFIGKPLENRKLYTERLWTDKMVLVIPQKHRWAGRKSVSLDEVAGEPFVIRECGSATRATLEKYLHEKKKRTLSTFNIIGEMGSSEAVKEAVIAGLGISIISIHAVRREIGSALLIEMPVRNCRIERDFYVINKKQLNLMKHHRLFFDFLRTFEISVNYGE
ncbi:MAG: selenium metabolism-associated LysR family transcriptional regulator [Thermodesulfobacteriota bacterium]|nr:selenium metabolism-associated LysR family transcriptional regulator [Thermodesulfobacteriota bacterium]